MGDHVGNFVRIALKEGALDRRARINPVGQVGFEDYLARGDLILGKGPEYEV